MYCSLATFRDPDFVCLVANDDIYAFLVLQVMHKVILPHFDVEKSAGERTFIYGCENDHG